MGAFGYYGVELFLKKISIFHVTPYGGNMNNTLKMKLNVSFLNNFPRATLLPLKSTSNWQTLTVCVRTIF